MAGEIAPLEAKLDELRARRSTGTSRRCSGCRSRAIRSARTRSTTSRSIFTDFSSCTATALFRDDPAIVGGWARLDGKAVMVIGHQKGRDTKENLQRNFGMPHPEGYRKALRLMKLAEQVPAPLITLIDTPGAYPGLGAEERGQSEAIARNLLEMSGLDDADPRRR